MTSRPQFNMTLLGQLDSKANVVLTCFQIEKNQVLTDENKKLKEKCSNLEELLSEEEMNIADMLELIRTMQLAAKNGGPNVATMPQISAVAAKLRRDYK